jgi:cation transport ATPase
MQSAEPSHTKAFAPYCHENRQRMTTLPLSLIRRFLWTGALLSAAVSILFLMEIIPLAKTDPRAASDWPVGAFRTFLGFNGIAAGVLCFFASGITSTSRRAAIIFALVMVLALLCAFALSDAAFSFASHGTALRTAGMLLHICSVADFLVATLVLATVVSLPKGR